MTVSPVVVSVIVPCFDVAEYLDECLGSLVGQTYAALDVVVVDDGSTDESGTIADRWATRDERVRVVHQSNVGLAGARNAGIDVALGQMLCFVDGDDLLPADAIERLVRSRAVTGSKLVCGVIRVWDGQPRHRATQQRSVYDVDRSNVNLRDRPDLVYDPMVCGKLFDREMWDAAELTFRVGSLFEDGEVTLRAHLAAGSASIVADTVYWWRRRDGGRPSITQRDLDRNLIEQRFAALARTHHHLESSGVRPAITEHARKILYVDLRQYAVRAGDDGARLGDVVAEAQPLVARIDVEVLGGCSIAMHLMADRTSNGDVAGVRMLVDGIGAPGRFRQIVAAGRFALLRPAVFARVLCSRGVAAIRSRAGARRRRRL